MRIHFQQVVQLAVILVLGLSLSCGGGSNSSPPPPPPGNAIQVTVQSSQTFQSWEAWRGTIGGPSYVDQNGTDRDLSPTLLNSALDSLVNDLGITGVRFELHAKQGLEAVNDDSNPFHINWSGFDFAKAYRVASNEPLRQPARIIQEVVIPLRARVVQNGDPFTLYVNNIYFKSDFPPFWLAPPPAPNLPGDEYAEMAQAAVMWLQNRSVPPAGFTAPLTPDYWVVANEPDIHSFASSDLVEMITRTGARFLSMPVGTKIQMIESTVPNPGMLNTTLNSPGVSQFVKIVSFHGYDYNNSPMPGSFATRNQTLTAAKGISARTAMTEICCRSGWNGNYDHALGWARDIYWNMTEANISIWEPLSLLFTCGVVGCTNGGGSPINIDRDLSKLYKFANYYGLRQFSHFIRPGYQRVAATCAGCSIDATIGQNVKPVAFQSPAGKIVLVVINDQSGSQAITLNGLPAGTYDITGVDPAHAQAPVTYSAQTIGAGQAVTLTFPAQAIVTFAQR